MQAVAQGQCLLLPAGDGFQIALLPGPRQAAEDPARALSLAVLSSVLPMAAALSVRHFLDVPEDLAGMSGKQLLSFGLAGGLFNSVGHNLYFAATAGKLEVLGGIVPMFVGDTLGTFIMLYLGALVLNRFFPAAKEH